GRVVPARQLVEAALQGFQVELELARQPDHREVVGHYLLESWGPRKMRTGPPGPDQDLIVVRPSRAPAIPRPLSYAVKDVPQPQLDLAWGLMNVKPPCSP